MSSSRRNANTRRDKKQQALAALRSGGGLDDYEVNQDDDIYDVVDEDEYQELVKKRRHREDFVVDDDGLGYYDDGEEHIGSGSHRTGAGQGDGDEAEDAGKLGCCGIRVCLDLYPTYLMLYECCKYQGISARQRTKLPKLLKRLVV